MPLYASVITKEVVENLHKFIANVYVTIGQTKVGGGSYLNSCCVHPVDPQRLKAPADRDPTRCTYKVRNGFQSLRFLTQFKTQCNPTCVYIPHYAKGKTLLPLPPTVGLCTLYQVDP